MLNRIMEILKTLGNVLGFLSTGTMFLLTLLIGRMDLNVVLLSMIIVATAFLFGVIVAVLISVRVLTSEISKENKVLCDACSKLQEKMEQSSDKILKATNLSEETKCNIDTLSSLRVEFADMLENKKTEKLFLKNIFKKKQMLALESEITKGNNILVLSSKLAMEREDPEFLAAILNNLRKGVKYTYFIPNDESIQADYMDILKKWRDEFLGFLYDNEALKKLLTLEKENKWNGKYTSIIKECANANNLTEAKVAKFKQALDSYLIKHLSTYYLDESHFFLTIVAYERKSQNWCAVIKMPTKSGEEFTAICVDEKNDGAVAEFIVSIRNLCKDKDKETVIESIIREEKEGTIA